MITEKEKTINSIKERLQFLVVLYLFFPELFKDVDIQNFWFKWSSLVGYLVIIYFLISIPKNYFHEKVLKFSNAIILFNSLIFVPIFLFLSKYGDIPIGQVSVFVKFSIQVFLWCLLILPASVIVALLGNVFVKEFKKTYKEVTGKEILSTNKKDK